MNKEIDFEKFVNTDFCNYSSYANVRQIASYIDGQKNASRKFVHTLMKKNINNFTRVDQLGPIMQIECEYLHGSADGVLVGMAQNFPGSNNLPLIDGRGNFGKKFNHEPAASRYIKARKSKITDLLFNVNDNSSLIQQSFEGTDIEPRYFLPILPLILVNGSEGISSGYSQMILPHNIKDIKKYISNKLNGKSNKKKLKPYFNNFKNNEATTQLDEDSEAWTMFGQFQQIKKGYIKVTELPPGMQLKKYIKILDKLEDTGKIKSYTDLSDNDNYEFDIKLKMDWDKKLNDITRYEYLGLKKKVTQNFTCLDENNRVVVFKNAEELIDKYIEIRTKGYINRKLFLIENLKNKINYNVSKALFIKGIIDKTIIIAKTKKEIIIKKLDTIDNILKDNNSYEYLLRMPLYSLTTEKIKELAAKVKELKIELKEIKSTSETVMWEKDLKQI